jgi:alpha-beta hydrolase superfamily lysophospholipase
MKFVFFLFLLLSYPLAYALEFYQISEAQNYQQYFYEVTDQSNEEHKVAAHLWSNNQKNLMVVAHGYTDNCGYTKPLIRWFLNQNYDVLCLELPGHGNSSGKRADISKIEVYYELYREIFPQAFMLDYQSFTFYGHSTGNIGMIEFLLENNNHRFDKIIMATPLIRSYLWKLSRLGHKLSSWFLTRLPKRPFHSENPEYKQLQKLDPYPFKTIPTHWYTELIAWNDKLLTDSRVSQQKIYSIFADKDTVIDYKFNKRFINDRFPNVQMTVIQGSDHNLPWEKEPITNVFYEKLRSILTTDSIDPTVLNLGKISQ